MHLLKIALVIFLVQNSVNLFAQAADISEAQIAAIPEQRWSNDSIKPALTVTMDQVQLAENTDYTAVYTDNVNKGTATVTITGKGNYTGTKAATFTIADFPLLDPESANSAENPYLISTEEDLKALAGLVNSGKRSTGFYKQTSDITMTKEHIAIGQFNIYGTIAFNGDYDGDNHTISNLTINKTEALEKPEWSQGLFGRLRNASVKNVKVVNCSFNISDETTDSNLGGIAGYANNSSISNCTVSGNLSAKTHVGGIVGMVYIESSVSGCSFSGTITADNYAGGIAGASELNSALSNNINYGSVTGASLIGGITGNNNTSSLVQNVNAGQVSGATEAMGGIAGQTDISNKKFTDNLYLSGLGLSGAIGALETTDATDIIGSAEIVVKVTAAEGVTLNLPDTPAFVWNSENYYRSGSEITLDYALPSEKIFDCYNVSSGYLSRAGVKEGAHVLSDFSDDVVISGSYTDEVVNIEGNATISGIPYLVFNGLQQYPKPVVKIGQTVLEESKNYELSYSGDCINAGVYSVTVTGLGRYTGTLSKEFRIYAFNISSDNAIVITGLDDDYPRTGDVIHPVPGKITCQATDNARLVLDTDYTLAYSNGCTLPGKYTLTITGKGNYSGQKRIDFEICDAYGFTINYGGYTYNRVPFVGGEAGSYQKNEYVVAKSKLGNIKGKTIYGLKFNMKEKAANSFGDARFRIFLKEVSSADITALNGTDGATVVYEGELDVTTNEYLTVHFTTPFAYGGDNLLVGIYEYEKGTPSTIYFRCTNTAYTLRATSSNSLDAIINSSKENYQAATTFLYDAARIDINDAVVSAIPDQRWSNSSATPAITVTYNNEELVENTDYVVEYSDNVNLGTAMVSITGRGNYWNTKAATFKIVDFPLLDPESANSEENPYLISTEEDLKALAGIVNSGARNDGFYKQTDDITLTQDHVSIGLSTNHSGYTNYVFKGSYDGDNHSVSNITINKTGSSEIDDSFLGLFGGTKDATIQNVKVVDCNITGYRWVGGIAGSASGKGTISNCSVSGTISITGGFVGGIVGTTGTGSLITNNINAATVTGGGEVAGIVGDLRGGSATYNVNTGTISGDNSVGGIIGCAYPSTTTANNFNIGQVTAHESSVGSIAGSSYALMYGVKFEKNYYPAGLGLPGGRGETGSLEGTDLAGAEVVVKISAADGVTLNLPETPAYVWGSDSYFASGTEVTLNYDVPNGKIFDCYTVNEGLISNASEKDGVHVLTDFKVDVVISGSYTDGIVSLESDASIAAIEDVVYNGLQQLPKPVVTVGEKVLVEGGNYELSYSEGCINVGTYTVTVTGIGSYTGTLTKQFKIVALDVDAIDAFEITGIDTDYPKTGAAINPVPTITNVVSKAKLVQGTDYTLSYSDGCILPGTYTLSIIGKGNYTGQKDIEFVIDNAYGLTVNDGEKLTLKSATPLNVSQAYMYQKNEFMLYANDIKAMNGQAIYGMKFYMNVKGNRTFGDGRFKVLLKEVEVSPSGFVCGDGATLVYDGELDVTTNEFLTIHFTTPHVYNGGNLVVGIYEYEKGQSVNVSFYCVTSNAGYKTRSDSYTLDASGYSNDYFQPKTTFLYEAESTTVADVVTVEEKSDDAWYDLSGKQLENEPTEKGLYFHGNHLYMITE